MKLALNCRDSVLAAAIFITCAASGAQTTPAPASPSTDPAPLPNAAPAPMRVEGTDDSSGTHYVRLSVTSSGLGMAPDLAPRFTLECREVKGKRDLQWFLSFGGVRVQQFEPPFKPSQGDPYPPNYHKVKLKMDFEGYMRSKPITRSWEELPTGEFRFCNSGLQCPNMETARFYMSYLNALPTLRIAFANSSESLLPEQVFDLRGLVEEANKTPICSR